MLIRAAVPQVHHPWLPPPIAPALAVVQKVPPAAISCRLGTPHLRSLKTSHGLCKARRRVRYEEEDEEEDTEEHAQNSEISLMEAYSEAVRDVALVVRATVDGEEETVLVFKGFSSCLSSRTSYDPSKSVLPARAVIECIDVVRGPFDPSNVEYLEKDLTWEAFKTRLQTNNR
ncbi:uncharacterized protein LOC135643357 [Musa acuminata AAA Group]|uniref:uncharacterized protein LOC135643357 n=1 Tax=Musa acuminata AAA Group TaxID=214697 RepID=UPI0031D05442